MSKAEDQLRDVVRQREGEDEARHHRYEEQSKRRLLRIVEKKLNTAFIGAISKFETYFGHMWGHRKDESELTPEQRKFRDLWSNCRTDILTNGNNQIRAVQAELVQYTMVWDGFTVTLTPREE